MVAQAKKQAQEKAIAEKVNKAEVVRLPYGGGGEDHNAELAWHDLNDLGNAERFITRHGRDVLYVREVGWHLWSGTHWEREGADELVSQKAHQTAQAIMDELAALQDSDPPEWAKKADIRKRNEDLFKWAKTSGNESRLKSIVSLSRNYLSVGPEDMDRDRFLINLRNGTLPLSGACEDLRDHDPVDHLAKVMDVSFDPEAICPNFQKFLDEVQPDPEIQKFLQMWVGYCLSGATTEQKIVFHFGSGGNGKSVFVDLIAKIMGPYAVSLPFTSLIRDDHKSGDRATPDLARLPGARFVRVSEPEQGARFAEASVKLMTGGEEMTVRHLNKGFFDFVPQFKLNLSGNHKPSIRGTDRGIWRRLLLVPWLADIPEDKQDQGLPDTLWEERRGVLNWMLDGARMWLEQGLIVPQAIRGATDSYKEESDPLSKWVSTCVKEHSGNLVRGQSMYESYQAWCRESGEKPWGQKAFSQGLSERGLIKRKSNGVMCYENVILVGGFGVVPSDDD